MGQALRNMLLDPANPKARDNLVAAQGAYDKAYKETAGAARGTPFESPVKDLAALRNAQGLAQDKVVTALAINVPQAIQTLNSAETPAWRQLRAELLKQIEAASKLSTQTHQEVQANASRATLIAIVLSCLASAVAVALALVVLRSLKRELGCEPDGGAGPDAAVLAPGGGRDSQLGRVDHHGLVEKDCRHRWRD
jgi:hypothetical protein